MATEAGSVACAYCGLPVRKRAGGVETANFCCYACRLVARIVGSNDQGSHAWNLLRLGVGALLAMNVMMLSLLIYSGAVEAEIESIFRWIMLGLASPALFVLLYPLVLGAWEQCLLKKPSLDLLIVTGSITAFGVSVVNTIQGSHQVFFDTATMLPVLVTLGKLLETTVKSQTADLLRSLETLLPATALRVNNGTATKVSLEELAVGDLLRIIPGERIAADGLIREGNTTIEEAPFTGEFMPRVAGPGSRVIAGTVNGEGTLLVEAERVGADVLLQRIAAMTRDAWANPSPAERIADRAATLFIPAVALVAAGSFLGWAMLDDLQTACFSALSVLVVACPCTMGIATPLATSLAIAKAAATGIIVRGGAVMEQLGKTDLVFFDKTGTLTGGQPVLHQIIVLDPQLEANELLALVATLESASEHPLARSVHAEAARRGLDTGQVTAVEIKPGRGLAGLVKLNGMTERVLVGRPSWVASDGAPDSFGDLTAVDVAWQGSIRGRLLFADVVRADAAPAVNALRQQGISTAVLSGDRNKTTMAVAGPIGINEVRAPLNPAEKVEAVAAAIAAGRNVAMVGDGINDAAAIAAAQVGIAIGVSMDLVRQAGDVVILSDRLLQVPWLISLSRQTRRIIGQNFAWSFGYNAIAVGAAAAGMLHPLMAAVAMVVSSLTVLVNSARITSKAEH